VQVQISGTTLEGMGNIPQNAEHSYQYLLIRLLLGTATVSRGSTRSKQAMDYSSLPATVQTKTPAIAVKDFLTSYSIGGSVNRLIRLTRGDNREFYKEILSEFMNFQIQTKRGNSTSAFVFLYRILERISYSVPLLYTSTQSDFQGTFNDLKSILNADIDGELGMFKKFLSKGRFTDPLKLQVAQKISFSNVGGHGANYYDLTSKRFTKFASTDQANHEVEIKFSEIPEFLITIRNRFFHSRTGDGKKNITTIEMPDSDEYFGKINPIIASFLAIVTLQTVVAKYHI
jgi:hypothetical protein